MFGKILEVVSMESVSNFCKTMVSDIEICIQNKHYCKADKSARYQSLLFRTLGLLTVGAAVGPIAMGVICLPVAPLLSLIYAVSAAAAIVFAHDYLVIGNNYQRKASLFTTLKTNDFATALKNSWQSAMTVAKKYIKATQNGNLYELQGTWLITKIYKLFNK
jgi:hypothetical protein